jgi:hypothetical protein
MPTNDPEYAKEYYRKNREKILAKKRKKYVSDSVFAERQRKRSLQSVRHRRSLGQDNFLINRAKKSSRRKSGPRLYEITVNGRTQEVLMYHIGDLAQLFGRKVKTLYMWERENVLPHAMFRDSANRRMYTKDQVNALVEAFHQVIEEAEGHRWLPQLRDAFAMVWKTMPQGVKE